MHVFRQEQFLQDVGRYNQVTSRAAFGAVIPQTNGRLSPIRVLSSKGRGPEACEGFKIDKVKDSDPHAFLILENDSKMPKRACDSLTENKLQGELSKRGLSELEKSLIIQKTREKPK